MLRRHSYAASEVLIREFNDILSQSSEQHEYVLVADEVVKVLCERPVADRVACHVLQSSRKALYTLHVSLPL